MEGVEVPQDRTNVAGCFRIARFAVRPTGLAVVRNLDPGSRVLAENLERVCAEFLAVGHDAIADRKRAVLNVCAGDWEQVRALLDAPPARPRHD